MIKLVADLFTQDECNSAVNEITQARYSWTACTDTDMHILGNSFLRNQIKNYADNDLMDFQTVELFRKKLSALFQKPVKFCNKLAKPGFQIIKRNGSKDPCVWHYDTILLKYPYNTEFLDYDAFDTYFENYYVLGLMLTEGQSSFDYFQETESEFVNTATTETPLCNNHHDLVGDDCGNADCQLREFQTVNYPQGTLLIQNKKILHRIGYADIDGTDSQRMTLQAYAVVKDDVIYLFW